MSFYKKPCQERERGVTSPLAGSNYTVSVVQRVFSGWVSDGTLFTFPFCFITLDKRKFVYSKINNNSSSVERVQRQLY